MLDQLYTPNNAKEDGAYYTPDAVSAALVHWSVHTPSDRMLDPSCGDGRFLTHHDRSVGIEQESGAAAIAMQRAPSALVHDGEFFTWAEHTPERFECAAGNPPFIRYQRFKGEVRQRALRLCAKQGVQFSGLASSWPLFLVATAALLKPGGRLAFVVPAEIGHAPYSAPLLEYLAETFGKVHIVAVRDKLFADLSEDCWLLYAEDYGAKSTYFDLTVQNRFQPSKAPPKPTHRVSVVEWRALWNRRLRPLLMPQAGRDLYRKVLEADDTARFGAIATIGIGYVSGANAFFHLRPSEIERWGIPKKLLKPSVRNSRALPAERLNGAVLQKWKRQDAPVFLLRLTKDMEIPASVERYLNSAAAQEAQEAYKCRVRDPWYVVPDVQVPDFFLSYMSGRKVGFVRNDARCTCTNSLHYVRVRDRDAMRHVLAVQKSPFFQMSCEIEGHPLGGGMLKLEPREAAAITIPSASRLADLDVETINDATEAMQRWRHYAH